MTPLLLPPFRGRKLGSGVSLSLPLQGEGRGGGQGVACARASALNLDLDVGARDAHVVAGDGVIGRIGQNLAGPDIEFRAVPGTRHLVTLDRALGQKPFLMGASVVEGEVPALDIEQGNFLALQDHEAAGAGGDLVRARRFDIFGHARSSEWPALAREASATLRPHISAKRAIHILIGRLSTASAASFTASFNVGCAWQMRARSSAEPPNAISVTASAIMVPASAPMICTPSTRSEVSSARILTKPSVVRLTLARPLAVKGNFPAL